MPGNFQHGPDSLELWFCRVGDATLTIEQASLSQLSPSEKTRFRATKSINKQREFLLSRALMRHALSQHFLRPENEWIFIERPNCAPTILNLPENIYLSLSHSMGYICFAVSKYPVGVDLEYSLKPRNFLSLADAFMNDEEIDCLKRNTEAQRELFYRLWCAKEAFYKAIPSPAQSAISLKNISLHALTENDGNWLLIERKNAQFLLAVAIKCNPKHINLHHFAHTNSAPLNKVIQPLHEILIA